MGGLGVHFSEDILRILRGLEQSVNVLDSRRGLSNIDQTYLAGYNDALEAVATSFGLTLRGNMLPPQLLESWEAEGVE